MFQTVVDTWAGAVVACTRASPQRWHGEHPKLLVSTEGSGLWGPVASPFDVRGMFISETIAR